LTGRPSTLLAYVFSVVIVPLIFPHSDRQAVWNAIRILLLGSLSTSQQSVLSSQQQQQQQQQSASLPTTPETQRRRPLLSPMEQKFYISRIPHVSWHKSSLSLEYTMAEWVTPAVIQHKLFEWDCKTELLPATTNDNENSRSSTTNAGGSAMSIWNARPPEQFASNTGPPDDESLHFATQRWRLTLDLDTGRFGLDEKDPTGTIVSNPYSFCVRWMLYNLPIGHEYSMEVTFQRTQLSVHYSVTQQQQSHDDNSDDDGNTDNANNDSIQIERVDVSIPEDPTIAINVNGRGRAIVHREL
jgi:hypothetical protein